MWRVYIDEDMYYEFETKEDAFNFAKIVVNQGKECFVKFDCVDE